MPFDFRKLGILILLPIAFVFISMNSSDVFHVNTSNLGKREEYRQYLSPGAVVFQVEDLKEPESDPLTIIRYKASCFEGVLVDDVSLDVEGLDVGVNVRWLIDHLSSEEYLGRSSVFSCLLAIRISDEVKIYKGEVKGSLVKPRGTGFGLGPYFLPEGAEKTLGEYMDPKFNARYIAIQNFKKGKCFATLPVLEEWKGKFQGD